MSSAKEKSSPKARAIAAAQLMQKHAVATAAPAAQQKRKAAPPLLAENVLAWDVLLAMHDQVAAIGGFGVAIVGYRYEALDFVFSTMVPEYRRREVFEKFLLLKPYALGAMRRDGRNGKGSDDPPAGAGRRKRSPRARR